MDSLDAVVLVFGVFLYSDIEEKMILALSFLICHHGSRSSWASCSLHLCIMLNGHLGGDVKMATGFLFQSK